MAYSSKSTTLVRPKSSGKSKDDISDCPTVDEIWSMHTRMKAWYTPRDVLIRQFIRMTELQSPFGLDKDGMQDGAVITATGDVEFDIATFPFDIISLAMASMDSLHPQAHCQPRGNQTEKQAQDFEMLMNAVLDMRMQRDNFQKSLIQKGAATGWFVLFHPYDNELNEKGEFPFDIKVMNPLGVYPMIDPRGEPVWVTYERRFTGAQLKQAYGMYPGIAEMFEDEPEESGMTRYQLDRYHKDGNSILTSTFTIVEYYNDTVRGMLLNAVGCSEQAALQNPTLGKYKKNAKEGKMQSVLVGSDHSTDNPYAGVLEHHLGKVPFSFGWCWPELRDSVAGQWNDDYFAGRYYGLPFLYSQFSNWRNISRILSALHSQMIRWANRPYVTDSDVTDLNTSIIKVSSGEGLKPLDIPTMPPEALKLLEQLTGEVDRASFAPSAYGAQAGTSGSQQNQNFQAGSVRMDTLRVEAERVTGKALYAIGCGMIEQGDETFSVYGEGDKYDGPYKLEYSVKGLKYPPAVKVKLMANDPFVDPEKVLEFKALDGIIPQETLYAKLLNIPNPKKIVAQMREEMVMKNDQNMAPYVQLGALERQNELFKQTQTEAWKLQENQDKGALWMKQKQAELDQSQVGEEQMVAEILARTAQQMPPPPGQPGGTPPVMGNPSSPQGNSQMPSMPPSQPNLQPPSNGLPPNLSMPGQDLPMPPQGGPPMPPPGMPPQGMMQRPPTTPANLATGAGNPQAGGSVPLPSVVGMLQRSPDDRGQPLQNLRRGMPPNSLGRPGVPQQMSGPNAQPGGLSPALQAINRSLTEPSLGAQVMGTQRSRKPRRARGGK